MPARFFKCSVYFKRRENDAAVRIVLAELVVSIFCVREEEEGGRTRGGGRILL